MVTCSRCDGEGGGFSELAGCTTGGPDCACNGPRVLVEMCPECSGTGVVSVNPSVYVTLGGKDAETEGQMG